MNDSYEKADTLADVVEQALALQRSANKALLELQTASKALAALQGQLPVDVKKTIDDNLEDAAVTAGEILASKLNRVMVEAQETTQAFETARRWLGWQLVLILVGLFAVTVAGMHLVISRIIPSMAEIQQLRQEREDLVEVARRLRAAGGDAVLATCDDKGRARLCVRVDDSRGAFVGGYRILQGH